MKQKQLIRHRFREAVFERDGHKCVFCDVRVNLDAHHITDRNLMPNGGYVKDNGITLCPKHHIDAEAFHISGGKEWVEGFHPNDLYKVVDSSYEQAYNASLRLK
jgi:5-methylcytosine-specific restriction endonuclease McrA